jgi:hypothetical protein
LWLWVYECRQKLKKEYEHLTNKNIPNRRRENKNLHLTEEKLYPLFAFMGDTSTNIFEKYQYELFQFLVIIIECTFINNEQHAERASYVKHII